LEISPDIPLGGDEIWYPKELAFILGGRFMNGESTPSTYQGFLVTEPFSDGLICEWATLYSLVIREANSDKY
jgi:hypothetical protein